MRCGISLGGRHHWRLKTVKTHSFVSFNFLQQFPPWSHSVTVLFLGHSTFLWANLHSAFQPHPPRQPPPLTCAHSCSSSAISSIAKLPIGTQSMPHCSHARPSSRRFCLITCCRPSLSPVTRPVSTINPLVTQPAPVFDHILSLCVSGASSLLLVHIALWQTVATTPDSVPSSLPACSPPDCSNKGHFKFHHMVCAAFGFTPQPFHARLCVGFVSLAQPLIFLCKQEKQKGNFYRTFTSRFICHQFMQSSSNSTS